MNNPTIVFLHGFLESSAIWDDAISELSKDFNCLTLDLPGHGNSKNLNMPHSMENMAKVVNDFLELKKNEKVVFVGHSMGGYVSLAFAELFPKKVKGICLLNSSALDDTELKKAERKKVIEVVKNSRFSFIQNTIPNLFPSYNVEIFKAEIDAIRKIASKVSEDGIIKALEGMIARPDRTHILKNADFPIQFIIGKDDPIINYELLLEQTQLPKDAHPVVFDKVGHMAFVEAKKETIKALHNFASYCYSIIE